MYKFLSEKELDRFSLVPDVGQADEVDNFNEVTTLWSAKEAVFKWYGDGGVDFRKQIQLLNRNDENKTIDCFFSKSESELVVNYKQFDGLVLAWVVS